MLFSAWFLKNNIYLVVFCLLTKSFYLVAFNLWDVRLYLYYNYFQPGCGILFFLSSIFFYMTKKSKQKFKHLENRKSFQDEKKSIFHNLWRTFIKANKTDIFGRWESDFKVAHKFLGLKFKRYRGYLLFNTLLKTESFLY